MSRIPASLIAGIVCLVLASPASAGIGNPLKKAKEKLEKAAEKKAPPEAAPEAAADGPVEFDEVVVELTNKRIEGILTAFEKSKAATAGRSALVEKLNQSYTDRGNHLDKNGEAIREIQNKRGDIETCYHDGYRKITDQRTKEYTDKALTDPAIRDKFAKAAAEHNAAAARGDSTALSKLNETLMSAIYPSSEDSANVRKSCGALPPPSAAETRLKDIDKQTADYEEQIRKIDEKVAKAQAGELDQQQWAVALERIRNYMAYRPNDGGTKQRQSKGGSKDPANQGGSNQGDSKQAKSRPAVRGFTRVEIDAIEDHLEQLNAALR